MPIAVRPALSVLSLVLLAACARGEPPVPPEAPAAPASPADAPLPALTMQQVLEAAGDDDWRQPDPANTLYMDLDGGRVVIELAPRFAPEHVANVLALVRAGYFDGLSINRSHDNFVVQWGDPNGEDPAAARPLGEARATLPAEVVRPAEGLPFTRLPDADGWAPEVGFVDGFPVGRDPKAGTAWLAHCYGMLGAGRGLAIDSSNGTELYVVTGQSPRQLDRNITTLGRVVLGIERLSALPRGTGPLGFYETAEERVPIRRVRVAADLPEAERERLDILRTDTATWDALVESRRNRRDEFYKVPAGHIDLCNVPVPVRETPAATP